MNAGPSLQSLTQAAHALKAQGRSSEAIAAYAYAAEHFPTSGAARHNLAAALGDAARHAEAEQHCRLAFAQGLDAPETWLVLARALQGQARLDDAEEAYRQALRRRSAMTEAHRDLAQLIWMRTGDVARATELLEQAIRAAPAPALRLIKAKALEFAGDHAGAYAALRAALQDREDPHLESLAADAAVRSGDVRAGLAHAQRAAALSPQDVAAQIMLAQVCLAAAAPDRAAAILLHVAPRAKYDQRHLALLATALRLAGDPRYRALYDYQAFVGAYRLQTPAGWPDLANYLADLAVAVRKAHAYETHPFEQSVRQGSQAPDILNQDDPAIRAFPEAVAAPIAQHLQKLGRGSDPVRARNSGRWRFCSAWSVKLKPNGFHADHVHPQGWLSSACYLSLPAAVEGPGVEGWLKFGQPGVATDPPLGPEHFIKPEPGLLALFPSYMWHGTVPFSGAEPRLTIAFDLLPA